MKSLPADASAPPRLHDSHERHGRYKGRALLPALLRGSALLLFLAIFVLFALRAPMFLLPGNLWSIVAQSSILGVLGFGMTIVVCVGGGNALAGGIDLSLAANMGLSASIYAVLARDGLADAIAIPVTLASGLALGALNALLVTLLDMLPLLATLGTMTLAAGIEQLLTRNATLLVDTPLRTVLGGTDALGLPVLADALLVLAALFVFVTRYTPLALNMQAIGENPLAARSAALNVRAYVAGSYLASGVCGALGGLFSAGFLGANAPGSAELLLPVIAATFLGVIFSSRLVPTIAGTLAASLFIGMLTNGFQLLNVSSYWVNGIQGLLMLAVVAATTIRSRT